MDTNITITPPRVGITEIDLCGWLGAAAPGDRLTYHRGFLALDCAPTSGRLPTRERVELLRTARRAMFAAENGLAHLMQRRHGADDYSYLIEVRPRPRAERRSVLAILAEQADPVAV
ncbi:MAG: hypothetical protein JWL84_2655 [Rhodospirillales bacterium]|nr:hypothetical protein [Rhodospirillales bacterium]